MPLDSLICIEAFVTVQLLAAVIVQRADWRGAEAVRRACTALLFDDDNGDDHGA